MTFWYYVFQCFWASDALVCIFVMPNRPGRVWGDLRVRVTSAFLGLSGEPVRRGYKDLKARYSILDTRHLILDTRHLTLDT